MEFLHFIWRNFGGTGLKAVFLIWLKELFSEKVSRKYKQIYKKLVSSFMRCCECECQLVSYFGPLWPYNISHSFIAMIKLRLWDDLWKTLPHKYQWEKINKDNLSDVKAQK